MKKEMKLDNALKKIENKKFNALGEIEIGSKLFLLSDWKIYIKKLNVILQEGMFLKNDNEFFVDKYADVVSFIISEDHKSYVLSNKNFLSLLSEQFKKEKKELKDMSCVLETDDENIL